jgi:hypothetical protein
MSGSNSHSPPTCSAGPKALCLSDEQARCEPAALRYRLLHVAARLIRTGRSWHLKIDRDWPWATRLATAFDRLRAAPWPA